jgi:hypothetical protein
MSLCEVCRKALPNFPVPEGNEDSAAASAEIPSQHGNWYRSSHYEWTLEASFLLHASWESLATSLSHDCPLCWTLWRCIRSSPIATPHDERVADFNAEVISINCEPEWGGYTIDICLDGLGLERRELGLYIWKTTEKWYVGKLPSQTSCRLTIYTHKYRARSRKNVSDPCGTYT